MAEGLASSRVEPMVELSTSLVALNDAISQGKLDIIKLVAKHAFGIGQQDLDEALLLTSVHTLLEQKHGSSSLNILIMILMRLGIDTELVGALKKHVKQNEIVVEGYQKMDFVLTVSCILRSLHKRQYESLKEMARRTFLINHHPSNIKTRTHLLQLLFDQNCLTPTSFRFLFAWLEVVGCSLYHNDLKDYCRRHNIKVPEWDSLVLPLKKRFPSTGEGKYDTHPRSCPRSFPATVSLPAAIRDGGGMIDSQSLSLRSKPPLPFPNSGGRKSDPTPSPTVSYMYRDSTEHPVEASGPTAMVATARGAPNTNVVLVHGYQPQEKASGAGIEPNRHFPMDMGFDGTDDESNDESGNSTELHHPQSESSQEGQKGKIHVDNWPLGQVHVSQGSQPMNSVVAINDTRMTQAISSPEGARHETMTMDIVIKIAKGIVAKERICQLKCCICKLLVIFALVLCVGGVSGGLTYYFIGPSPGDTNVTLAQNATVNIGCFDLLHIGHFVISAVAQTSFKFLAVPSSSVVPTKISFPDMNYKRAGTGYYVSLNYYHTGYYDPLYSAGSGTVSYYTNFTNFDPSSCFYLYLFNSLDSYREVLKNLGPARGFINKFVFCPNSTDKVFNFTFPLHTVGFYYVAAFMPSNMNIDVKISAEIFTYDITYLEGLGVQSCLLDDGKCLLDVGHHPVHAHSESVCLLASSSSQLYGETINGTISPQRYLYNARTVSTFLTGCVFVVSIIILCPCIFCIITKFCASRRKSRDGYLSL